MRFKGLDRGDSFGIGAVFGMVVVALLIFGIATTDDSKIQWVEGEPEVETVDRVDFACWQRGAMMPLILEDNDAARFYTSYNRAEASARGYDKDGDWFVATGCYFLRTHFHTDTIYPAYNVMERARDAVQ